MPPARTANHEVVTFRSATVHYAAYASQPRYHVLACNGRSVEGRGKAIGSTTTGVTCKACLKGASSGRIEVAR